MVGDEIEAPLIMTAAEDTQPGMVAERLVRHARGREECLEFAHQDASASHGGLAHSRCRRLEAQRCYDVLELGPALVERGARPGTSSGIRSSKRTVAPREASVARLRSVVTGISRARGTRTTA